MFGVCIACNMTKKWQETEKVHIPLGASTILYIYGYQKKMTIHFLQSKNLIGCDYIHIEALLGFKHLVIGRISFI